MNRLVKTACCCVVFAVSGFAHGNVTPQAMDTKGLVQVGDDVIVNPFRNNKEAIEIGELGYGSNCARCHGLGAVSGGIAPDLRYLERADDDTDEYFMDKALTGIVRNGNVYMPPFKGILSNEAIWSIRAWLETVPVD